MVEGKLNCATTFLLVDISFCFQNPFKCLVSIMYSLFMPLQRRWVEQFFEIVFYLCDIFYFVLTMLGKTVIEAHFVRQSNIGK